jgi:hypothetical protein
MVQPTIRRYQISPSLPPYGDDPADPMAGILTMIAHHAELNIGSSHRPGIAVQGLEIYAS